MSGKTGTTESHRSSGFVGFTNHYAAANYIFADSSNPSGICSFPLRECGSGDLYGGNEPARTWFEAMKPIANDFGDVHFRRQIRATSTARRAAGCPVCQASKWMRRVSASRTRAFRWPTRRHR